MHQVAWLCAALLSASPTAPDGGVPAGDLVRYEEARKAIGRDADAHVALALWCEARGLQAERTKHLALAVLIDPAHTRARGLMGLVDYRGHWRRPRAVAEEVQEDQALTVL